MFSWHSPFQPYAFGAPMCESKTGSLLVHRRSCHIVPAIHLGLGSGSEQGNFGQNFKILLKNLCVFILFLTYGLTVYSWQA